MYYFSKFNWITVAMCSRTSAQKMMLITWLLTSPCDRQDSQRKCRKHGFRSRSARPYLKMCIYFWHHLYTHTRARACVALRTNACNGLRMLEVYLHTTNSRQVFSVRVISLSQRPLPDNTQHTQLKNIQPPLAELEPAIPAGERPLWPVTSLTFNHKTRRDIIYAMHLISVVK